MYRVGNHDELGVGDDGGPGLGQAVLLEIHRNHHRYTDTATDTDTVTNTLRCKHIDTHKYKLTNTQKLSQIHTVANT